MSADPDDVFVDVRVQPRSSREGIEGIAAGGGGRVRVRVHAAPVDGAANRRVAQLIAKAFGVAPSQVELVAGAASRDKRLRVRGPRLRPPWLEGRDPG